mmetsp:Transcript_75917/g.201710  ORF Transcript_75917/g.201710 Transcript_75917/m.201710 type:complete len:248 (-) Transcript_75917:143-886(-)
MPLRAFRVLLLPALVLGAQEADAGASLQLFSESSCGTVEGSSVVVLNFADTARLWGQCSSLISLCVQNATDGQCRHAGQGAAPRLRVALGEMTGALVSLPAEIPLDVRDTITGTLLLFTSNISELVPQFAAVDGCDQLEAAVTALCIELLELAPRIMSLVIPVVVLAVLGVGGCVFYCLSCMCLIFCNCGVLPYCLGRRRSKRGRRVSFQSRVICVGDGSSRPHTAALSNPLRKKKGPLGMHMMALH